MAGFESLHFSAALADDAEMARTGARPMARRSASPRGAAPNAFASEEAAARFYLSSALSNDARPGVRGLTAPQSPQVVPDLQLRDSRQSPLTGTSIVRFGQTKDAIPIFGANAVVELDNKRELLSIDAQLADVRGVTPIAALAPGKAIEAIAKLAAVAPESLNGCGTPELNFYHDESKDRWHLVWYVRNVPAAPKTYFEGLKSHGHGRSLSFRKPQLDYLVDAHDGTVLHYWSASPTLVRCEGPDEDGIQRTVYGTRTANGIALHDPLRRILTVDFGRRSIDEQPVIAEPLCRATSLFADCGAAISAHYNAGRVSDFLRSVLMRDGVDDKGMEIISFVNCTSPSDQTPPEWHNAVWWNQRMWYGQTKDRATGALRSLARHLDIIAHELAHGVTEHTANLVYRTQSGALNESFSDIFGVIIRNWDFSDPENGGDAAGWDWEIGSNFGGDDKPLRDMRDPGRTGDPAHMDDYSNHPSDNGGVHTNSNIHNKAAYNLLTARRADGSAVMTPREVAVLYYLTLQRLDRLATFRQTRATLLNVAATYFLGDPENDEKLGAIKDAYDAVGIR